MKSKVPDLSVTFGEGVATVRRHGSSSLITANVIGREILGGKTRVFLDRLIHRSGDLAAGWGLEGCVSTILVEAGATEATDESRAETH